jgi:hypothetical protein
MGQNLPMDLEAKGRDQARGKVEKEEDEIN